MNRWNAWDASASKNWTFLWTKLWCQIFPQTWHNLNNVKIETKVCFLPARTESWMEQHIALLSLKPNIGACPYSVLCVYICHKFYIWLQTAITPPISDLDNFCLRLWCSQCRWLSKYVFGFWFFFWKFSENRFLVWLYVGIPPRLHECCWMKEGCSECTNTSRVCYITLTSMEELFEGLMSFYDR